MNKIKISRCIVLILLMLGALTMIMPFLWGFSTSFKTMQDYAMSDKISFSKINFENYRRVLLKNDIGRYALNSIFISSIDVLGLLMSCSLVGYGLGVLKFKGSNVILAMAIATMFLPGTATMVPVYLIWNKLGAVGTYIPLILPSFLGSAFGIFLLRQFYATLPNELFEAARIDGCNPGTAFWYIYLPLTKTPLAALAVFSFINSWSNYLGPLIYLHDKAKYTLTIGLAYLKGQYSFDVPAQMAASMLTILPVMIIFIFLQRFFIEGIASAGKKG